MVISVLRRVKEQILQTQEGASTITRLEVHGVGGAGFNTIDYGGITFTNGGAAGSTTIVCAGSGNETVSGPITVPENHTLQISNTTNVSANNLYTLTVEESSQGLLQQTNLLNTQMISTLVEMVLL